MAKVRWLVALVFAWSMVGGVQPASAAQGPYRAWVACSTSKNAPPSHACRKGDAKAAFFKSRDASVQYTVCVRDPSGTRLCASHQPAPKGKVVVNTITSALIGEHRVTWSVAGNQVRA